MAYNLYLDLTRLVRDILVFPDAPIKANLLTGSTKRIAIELILSVQHYIAKSFHFQHHYSVDSLFKGMLKGIKANSSSVFLNFILPQPIRQFLIMLLVMVIRSHENEGETIAFQPGIFISIQQVSFRDFIAQF